MPDDSTLPTRRCDKLERLGSFWVGWSKITPDARYLYFYWDSSFWNTVWNKTECLVKNPLPQWDWIVLYPKWWLSTKSWIIFFLPRDKVFVQPHTVPKTIQRNKWSLKSPTFQQSCFKPFSINAFVIHLIKWCSNMWRFKYFQLKCFFLRVLFTWTKYDPWIVND